MGTPSRPTAKRARQKVLLINGGQHLCGASLERPVRDTRHAQRAFLLLSGLRNIHSPNIRRLISLTVYRLKHGLNPYLEALLRLRHGLPVHPRGRVRRNRAELLPNPLLGAVVGQGPKPEPGFTPRLRVYSFAS